MAGRRSWSVSMATIVLCIFLIFINGGYTQSGSGMEIVTGGSYNNPCNTTSQCTDKDGHTFCSFGSCRCSSGYTTEIEGNNQPPMCVPYINTKCDDQIDCVSDLTNMYCSNSNQCLCQDGLMYSSRTRTCVYGLDQACSWNSECGHQNLSCKDTDLDGRAEKCLCAPGFFRFNNKCLQALSGDCDAFTVLREVCPLELGGQCIRQDSGRICQCGDDKAFDSVTGRCIKSAVGNPCNDSSVCTSSDVHSLCDSTKGQCVCKPGFIKSATRPVICQPVVNSSCSDSCPDGSNTVCKESTCVCEPGYYHNETTRTCQLIQGSPCRGLRDLCQRNGDRMAYCRYDGIRRNSFCDCNFVHYHSNVTNLCEPALGSSCDSNQQCADRYRSERSISCQDTNKDGVVDTCRCKEGYFRLVEMNTCERIFPRTACRDGYTQVSGGQTPARKRRAATGIPAFDNNDNLGACIKVNSEPLTWIKAERQCRRQFGNLLSLSDLMWPNPYALLSLTQTVKDGLESIRYWTSMFLTTEPTRQKFMWEGQYPHPVNYSSHRLWQWHVNQPLPLYGHCGEGKVVNFNYQLPFVNMTSQKCDSELASVCTSTAVQAVLQEGQNCPDGWLGSPHLAKCFKFVEDPRTHSAAMRNCRANGGQLYVPTSNFDREFVFAEFLLKEVQYSRVGIRCSSETGICNTADGRRVKIEDIASIIGMFNNRNPNYDYEDIGPVSDQDRPEPYCLVFKQAVAQGEGPSSSSVSYFEADCAEAIPYICERNSSTTAPVTRVSISEPVFDKTTNALTYTMSGYDQNIPVTLIKDGLFNPNRKMIMPNSTLKFPLELTPEEQGSPFVAMGDLQGYYRIRVWGANPYQAYYSNAFLVRDENIYTVAGTIKSKSLKGSPRQYTQPMLFVGTEHDSSQNSLLSQIAYAIKGIGNNVSTTWTVGGVQYQASVDMVLVGLRYVPTGGLLADFRAYVRLSSASIPSVLRRDVEALQYVTDMEDKAVVHRLENYLSTVVGRYGFINNSVELRSTRKCPKDVVFMPNGVRVSFPLTDIGKVAESREMCLDRSGLPLASRHCQGNFTYGYEWGVVIFNCEVEVSTLTPKLGILANMNTTEDNVEEVASNAANLTEESGTALTSTDIIYTSQIIDAVSDVDNVTEEIGQNLFRTVNNVLRSGRRNIALAQKFDNSSSRITGALEKFGKKFKLRGRKMKRFLRSNVAMEIWDVDTDNPVIGLQRMVSKSENETMTDKDLHTIYGANTTDVRYIETDTAIILPEEIFDKGTKTNRLTFTVYEESSFFLSTQELNDTLKRESIHIANSRVVAAAIGGKTVKGLKQPVVTLYKPLKNYTESYTFNNTVCEFWNFTLNDGFGGWSSDGCVYQGMKDGRYVCHCDHLTNFAVLVDLYGQDGGISEADTLALSIISIIGLSLSIAGLSLVVLSFILFEKLRKGRSQQTLFNLALAILCSNIVFLVGINQTQSYGGCIAVAVLLHYFILASFMWMLVEAILQYLDFVKVLGTYISKFILKASIPAWLIPAIACAIVLGIDVDLYNGGEQYCWMKTTAFYYSFLIPVATIILVNTITFIIVIKGLTCDRPKNIRTNQSKHKVAMVHLRAGICCFVVLGLTWVFGFFAIADARLVFQYLFCIFNSIQGFLIFIFHNIREPRVREAWKRLCCKKQHRREKYEKGNTAPSSNTNSSGNGSSNQSRPINRSTNSTGYTSDSSGYTNLQFKNNMYENGRHL